MKVKKDDIFNNFIYFVSFKLYNKEKIIGGIFYLMQIFKKERMKKIAIIVMQVITIGSLFLFVFSREAISFFKDILDKIPLNQDFETLLYKMLLPFKMLVNSHSICAILFLVSHILCFTYHTNITYLYAIPAPSDFVKVTEKTYTVCDINTQSNDTYLQTMRLLF